MRVHKLGREINSPNGLVNISALRSAMVRKTKHGHKYRFDNTEDSAMAEKVPDLRIGGIIGQPRWVWLRTSIPTCERTKAIIRMRSLFKVTFFLRS